MSGAMTRFRARKARLKIGRRRAGRAQGFQEEGQAPFESVMDAAKRAGLLKDKSSRISGRVSAALIEQAKRRTGIESDTDLIEFALASTRWRRISPRRSRLPTARWTPT